MSDSRLPYASIHEYGRVPRTFLLSRREMTRIVRFAENWGRPSLHRWQTRARDAGLWTGHRGMLRP